MTSPIPDRVIVILREQVLKELGDKTILHRSNFQLTEDNGHYLEAASMERMAKAVDAIRLLRSEG